MTSGVAITNVAQGGGIAVAGELDAATCPPVRAAALSMLTERAQSLDAATRSDRSCVLDLSEVSFAASAALSLLLELDARAVASDLALAVVVEPEGALDIQLQRTGLRSQLTVLPGRHDEAEAPTPPQ